MRGPLNRTGRHKKPVFQHHGNRRDGTPAAGRHRHAEQPVKRTEVADDLNVPPVLTEHETVVPGEDSQQPSPLGRKADWQRWLGAGVFGQDADEASQVRAHRLARERIVRNHPQKPSALADDNFRCKRKPAGEFSAEATLGDWLTDHERPSRPDVDYIEVSQLLREYGRPKGPVAANIDAAEQDNQ